MTCKQSGKEAAAVIRKLFGRANRLLIRNLRRVRLFPRLISLLLVCSIIPLVLLSLLVFYNTRQLFVRRTYNNIQKSIELYTMLMDSEIQKYNDRANRIAANTDTWRILSGNSHSAPQQWYSFLNTYNQYLSETYLGLGQSMGRLLSVEVLDDSGVVAYSPHSFTEGATAEHPLIQRARQSGQRNYWQVVNLDDVPRYDYSQRLPLARGGPHFLLLTTGVFDYSGSQVGYVNFVVGELALSGLLETVKEYGVTDTDSLKLQQTLVVDENFKVVSAGDKDRIGTLLPGELMDYLREKDRGGAGQRPVIIEGVPYLLFDVPSRQSNFRTVMTINYDEFLREINDILRIIWITVLLCLVFIALVASVFIRSINRPVGRLVRRMAHAQGGGLNEMIDDDGRDEIHILIENYNRMLARIRQLMDDAVTNEKKKRDAQYNALVAQINPHFLYNTLDMLNWMAYADGNEELCETLGHLSRFFRLSLKPGGKRYTIARELEHVASYMAIQQQRFKGKLEYTTRIDEAALDCEVVKVVIQPLVENAILHGLMPRGGHIRLEVEKRGERIVISVIDDGVGLPPELLDKSAWKQSTRGSHGMYSVDERIRLLFGEEYGLEMRNNETGGAVAVLTLPAVCEAEDEAPYDDFISR